MPEQAQQPANPLQPATPEAPSAAPPVDEPVVVSGHQPAPSGTSAPVTGPCVDAARQVDVPVTEHAPLWGFAGTAPLLGRKPATARPPWLLGRDGRVPDTCLDAAELHGLQLRAGSVRGFAHRLQATVRQDSYALGVAADGAWAVLGVSDGVGSASRSHLGSRLLVDTAVDVLSSYDPSSGSDWPSWMHQAVTTACALLGQHSSTQGLGWEDLASTLVLAAVATGPGPSGHTVHLARVGDSTALHLRADGVADLFTDDDAGAAVHSTATDSLPGHADRLVHRTHHLLPGEALLLATDGFHGPALSSAGSHYLTRGWTRPPGVDEVLRDLNFLAKSQDDDRTVVGCWPGQPS